jgi:DNA repair exonuclease SbcCD ATPase subunit
METATTATQTETSLIVQEPGIFQGLTTETANTLKAAFEPFKAQIEEWQANAAKINVTDESQVALMKEAGIARKAVAKVRIAIEHKRKELKEDSLKKGQVIDKIANGFKTILEKLESNLQQQEDFAKIQETARINKAHSERFAMLNGLGYSYSGNDLGTMQQDVFNGLVTIAEQQKAAREEEARRAEEQAKIDAENKRLADEKEKTERERINKENEELRIKNEAIEKQLANEKELREQAEGRIQRGHVDAPVNVTFIHTGAELSSTSDEDCLKNLLTQIQGIKPLQPKAGEAQAIVEEVVTTLEEAESIIRNYLNTFCPEQ